MRIAIVLAATLALLALPALPACQQERSARCQQTCAKEYECAAQSSSAVPFDEKECIAACATLESDPRTVAKVQQHADCVAQHPACSDVLECR